MLVTFGNCWSLTSLCKEGRIVRPSVSKQCAADGLWRIWQGSVSKHGLLDTAYPRREHLNNVQFMVSGEYCEGARLAGHG